MGGSSSLCPSRGITQIPHRFIAMVRKFFAVPRLSCSLFPGYDFSTGRASEIVEVSPLEMMVNLAIVIVLIFDLYE